MVSFVWEVHRVWISTGEGGPVACNMRKSCPKALCCTQIGTQRIGDAARQGMHQEHALSCLARTTKPFVNCARCHALVHISLFFKAFNYDATDRTSSTAPLSVHAMQARQVHAQKYRGSRQDPHRHCYIDGSGPDAPYGLYTSRQNREPLQVSWSLGTSSAMSTSRSLWSCRCRLTMKSGRECCSHCVNTGV